MNPDTGVLSERGLTPVLEVLDHFSLLREVSGSDWSQPTVCRQILTSKLLEADDVVLTDGTDRSRSQVLASQNQHRVQTGAQMMADAKKLGAKFYE